MRLAMIVACLVVVPGCVQLRVSRAPSEDDVTVSPPDEEGQRYVAVEGGPLSSPSTLRRRFRGTAERACEGDYQLVSEDALTIRRAGLVSGRVHEGYVRCVLPDDSEPATGDTQAEQTQAQPPSRRAARQAGRKLPRVGG